jgi:transposase InsO family protein
MSPRAARRAALAAEIRRLFAAHRGTYGSPRITADLRAAGWTVSTNTVAAIMGEQGLEARRTKKRQATTRPGRGRWRAPDLVKRDFPAQKINAKWYGDGTEIPTGEGKLYLASVMDMASRRVLGFALGEHTTRRWPTARWRWRWRCAAARCPASSCTPIRAASTPRAWSARPVPGWASPSRWAGPGPRWTTRSSSPGTRPWNSSSARVEHLETRAAARARVPAWIEDYNRHRRHSALGMMSPIDYERALQTGQAA